MRHLSEIKYTKNVTADLHEFERSGHPEVARVSVWSSRCSSFFLVSLCVALGLYFCWLQTTYYQHYQPFFDSLSYYNEIHLVMTAGQNEGVVAAIREVMDTPSTVFMPQLIAAIASNWVSPSRNFGVWLQMFELYVLLASLMYYYRRVHGVKPWPAIVLVLPVTMLGFFYQRHGGMSDFRMDLSLCLTYAIACVWYLIAVATLRWTHFLALGVIVSVACLFRATAPVYLLIALGPVAVAQLYFSQNRWKMSQGFAITTVTVIVGALWFFVSKFDVLHHYYFVWNTDANAKLPISQSWLHIKFAIRHAGGTFWYWLLLMNGILLWLHGNDGQQGFFANVSNYLKTSTQGADLRLLWFGVAPLAMLVLRGAGLNPYVCLPAVAGLYLFALEPFAKDRIWFQNRQRRVLTFGLLVIAATIVINDGIRHHKKGDHQSMAAHQTIIRTMVDDADVLGLKKATFDSSHVFFLHTGSLVSTMRFDVPEAEFQGRKVRINDIEMSPRGVFSSCVAASDWSAIKGTSKQKLDHLIARASVELDYLVMPIGDSVDYMQTQVSQNVINRHQTYLGQQLLSSGQWEPVGVPVENRTQETVQLYRNRRRIAVAQQRALHKKLDQTVKDGSPLLR